MSEQKYIEHLDSELRKAIKDDAEYRAHHLSIALHDLCPDGYRVIDYRNSKFGDTVVDTDGSAYSPSCGLAYPVLIIEKIEPELPPITEDTVLTEKMSVNIKGTWEKMNTWVGNTIKYSVENVCTKNSASFRYLNKPETEFTYTNPIEWIDPDDGDATRRRMCQFMNDPDEDEWSEPMVLGVVCKMGFVDIDGCTWLLCRMDIRQRGVEA